MIGKTLPSFTGRRRRGLRRTQAAAITVLSAPNVAPRDRNQICRPQKQLFACSSFYHQETDSRVILYSEVCCVSQTVGHCVRIAVGELTIARDNVAQPQGMHSRQAEPEAQITHTTVLAETSLYMIGQGIVLQCLRGVRRDGIKPSLSMMHS